MSVSTIENALARGKGPTAEQLLLYSSGGDEAWRQQVGDIFGSLESPYTPDSNSSSRQDLSDLLCEKAKQIALACNTVDDKSYESQWLVGQAIYLTSLAEMAGMDLDTELDRFVAKDSPDTQEQEQVFNDTVVIDNSDVATRLLETTGDVEHPGWLNKSRVSYRRAMATVALTTAMTTGTFIATSGTSASAATLGANSSVTYSKMVSTPDKATPESAQNGIDLSFLGSSAQQVGNVVNKDKNPLAFLGETSNPQEADNPSKPNTGDSSLSFLGSGSDQTGNTANPSPTETPTPTPPKLSPISHAPKNTQPKPQPQPKKSPTKTPAKSEKSPADPSQVALKKMENMGPDWHNRAVVMEILIKDGWKPNHAAGAIGNLCVEAAGCDLNPNRAQFGYSGPDSGMGVGQWNKNGRWQTLIKKANEWGLSPTSIEAQAEFINWEVRNTERVALGPISAAGDVNQSTYVFAKYYERPGSMAGLGVRQKWARDTMNEYQKLVNESKPHHSAKPKAHTNPKPKAKPQKPVYKNVKGFPSTANLNCADGSTNQGLETTSLGNTIRLCKVGGAVVNASMSKQTVDMFAAARVAGYNLTVNSSHRPKSEQIALRKQHCGPTHYDIYEKPPALYGWQKPPKYCDINVQIPGLSLHEQGEALDLSSNGVSLNPNMAAYQWLSGYAKRTGVWWSLGAYSDALHWQDRPPSNDYTVTPNPSMKSSPQQNPKPKPQPQPAPKPSPEKPQPTPSPTTPPKPTDPGDALGFLGSSQNTPSGGDTTSQPNAPSSNGDQNNNPPSQNDNGLGFLSGSGSTPGDTGGGSNEQAAPSYSQPDTNPTPSAGPDSQTQNNANQTPSSSNGNNHNDIMSSVISSVIAGL